ncbi:hypothetical protein A3K73_08310 [Candidatus Pacearchaeota archaeon RBG_13_36_9]|nr:MAG: hypothetical protein A3K73_08310 [Candidatus Pacearchaeota archaeon RBG_13_36_9]
MKITKFVQSCVLIETNGKKILVDPGSIQYEPSLLEGWKQIDALLVTHKHFDHCNPEAIKEITKNTDVKFYTSQEVLDYYPNLEAEKVKEGDIINVGKVKIEVARAVHGYIPILKGEKEVHQNIGFIIQGDKRIYITSDTICFRNDYKCNILIAPITNHGIVMGPYEAALFAKETEAKLVVPVHYDSPKYEVDLEKVRQIFNKEGINYKFLNIGESIEV